MVNGYGSAEDGLDCLSYSLTNLTWFSTHSTIVPVALSAYRPGCTQIFVEQRPRQMALLVL